MPAAVVDWRPSRLFAAALGFLGLAAAIGVLASDLPAPWSWGVAALAFAEGLRLARRHLAGPHHRIEWRDTSVTVDGRALASPVLRLRGPVAVLRGRRADGLPLRLAWFPDTLPPAARRELRLAAAGAPARASTGAMAP